VRLKRKDEDLKMDEASIVSAIQADLQNYKVKTQIRRKESQLHVLITRADGDDVDYASLYDIVKRRIDKLPIEGADSLVVYGRLSGAKRPEWHKTAKIKPPLPLIEFDLDDLEDFGNIATIENQSFSTDSDETELQSNNSESLESDLPDDLKSFKNSIDNDLKVAATQTKSETNKATISNIEIGNSQPEDFDLDNLELPSFDLDSLHQNAFELESFDPDPFELNSPNLHQRLPLGKKSSSIDMDADFSFDSPTVAVKPMPMPPPPTVRRNTRKNVPNVATEPVRVKPAYPWNNKSLMFSGIFAVVAIVIVGICGWLVWNRSHQEQYIANARNFSNQDLNLKKITKLETLTEKRNRLQTIILSLEGISDRPASLYTDAQSELTTLRPKLAEFDRKINVEQAANKNIESSKNLTIESAKLTQNPPHKSSVWKSAQDKRQQALKLLEDVPVDSMLYANAQDKLKAYRTELVQISKWVEIQQRAESASSNVNPAILNQIKQLKSKSSDKQEFLPQCQTILQPKISNAESERTGLPIATLTSYLCAYFGDY
jgi:hypothetical protein